MSESTSNQTEGESTTEEFFPFIPNDKTGTAGSIFLGLSILELASVVLVPLALFQTAKSVFQLQMSIELTAAIVGSGILTFVLVYSTPWYLSPKNILLRNWLHIKGRFKYPIVGEGAREIPGIVDYHPQWRALELESGALVSLVEADMVNNSGLFQNQWGELAVNFKEAFRNNVSRKGGHGFDVQFQISQYDYDPFVLEQLSDAAEDGDLSYFERLYAQKRIDHIIDKLADQGVKERTGYAVVKVDPIEGLDLSAFERNLARLPFWIPEAEQKERQGKLLLRRVESVKSALESETSARALSAEEAMGVQRAFWQDKHHDALDMSQVAVDSDTPVTASLEDGGDSPDEDATDTDPDADEDGGSGGRVGRFSVTALRETLTSLTDDVYDSTAWKSFAPIEMDRAADHAVLNRDQYVKCLYVVGWPKTATPGDLEDVVTTPHVRMDTSLFLYARDRTEKYDDVSDEEEAAFGDAIVKEWLGQSDSDSSDDLGAQKSLEKEELESGVEFSEGVMLISVRGPSLEAVEDAAGMVEDECNRHDISTREATKFHPEALKATAPLGYNAVREEAKVNARFDFHEDAIGALFPFVGDVRTDDHGIIQGYAKPDSGDSRVIEPLALNWEKRTTGHKAVFGRSGTGKTAGENEDDIEDHIINPGGKTVVIDIARGFDALPKMRPGSKVEFGETTINPWELHTPEEGAGRGGFEDRVELITSIFMMHINHYGATDNDLRPRVEQIVRETYNRFGIYGDSPETFDDNDHPENNPINDDFFGTVDEMYESPTDYVRDSQSAVQGLKEDLDTLDKYLNAFKPGRKYDYLNGQSEVDLEADTVLLDANRVENSQNSVEKAIAILIGTTVGYEVAKQTPRKVKMVMDEAHTIFSDEEEAENVAELVRAGRNYGLVFTFLTQATSDLLSGPGKVVFDQSSTHIWHEVGSADASDLRGLLPPEYSELVRNDLDTGDNDATDRSEALVRVETGEWYIIEKDYSGYLMALVEYQEDKHGNFTEYMADRIDDVDPDVIVEGSDDHQRETVEDVSEAGGHSTDDGPEAADPVSIADGGGRSETTTTNTEGDQ